MFSARKMCTFVPGSVSIGYMLQKDYFRNVKMFGFFKYFIQTILHNPYMEISALTNLASLKDLDSCKFGRKFHIRQEGEECVRS